MLSFASFVVFHPRASILHLLLPFTRPRRAFTCVSCKEFKAKSKRLSSDYFALLNNRGFSYAPSPFRSVGTQKEKPSLTSRGLSQMASYLVYLTANTLSCISLITTATSYHSTLQRYAYYLKRAIAINTLYVFYTLFNTI